MSDSSVTSPLLRVRDIEKSFPGVRALSGVSFEVGAGEVHALVGENGAGKSTLIKIVSGVYQADGGAILIDGRETRFARPEDAKRAGVATIYQELLLFPELTVAENILGPILGRPGRRALARAVGPSAPRPHRFGRMWASIKITRSSATSTPMSNTRLRRAQAAA